MDIHCKRCSEPIQAPEVNLDTSIAKCLVCNAVFDIRDQINGSSPKSRTLVDIPKNMKIQSTMDGLEIIRKWFSKKIIALLVFCLFWDGFMVVWFGIALKEGQWAMAAFGTIHALVGLGLSYYLVCGFVNRTHIEISFRNISIQHQPMPWPGNKVIPIGDVKQVFTKRKVHRNKNGSSYTYGVHFLDHTDQEKKLFPGLESAEQALYIEQEIEKTLGIKDAAVEGELSR
jgi:hypothetical protein